jgi:hypothetical protein
LWEAYFLLNGGGRALYSDLLIQQEIYFPLKIPHHTFMEGIHVCVYIYISTMLKFTIKEITKVKRNETEITVTCYIPPEHPKW